MKKNFKYFAMAAMAILSMSACNKEIDEQVLPDTGKGKQPVEFKMTLAGTNTRTTTGTDAARTTTWNEGDAVGIFVYEAGQTTHPVIANAKYVLTGDTWAAEAGSEIYPEATYDYYAYYPYQEGATNPAQISISAKADQSAASGADYGASDVLASQNKNVAANVSTVPLTFKHMFAMIEVKIDGDKVTQQPAKVELKGVKLDATLDIITSTPTAALASNAVATDITMYYLTKTENATTAPFSFRAVVPAQEIAAATPLVAIYDVDGNGKTYTMQHTAAVPYEPGNFRLLNVTIGTAKVSLEIPKADLTIDPWGASEPIDGEGSEVIAPTTLLDLTTEIKEHMAITDKGSWSTDKLADKQDYWFRRINEKTIVTFDSNESAIKAANTAARGAWATTSFGYHCGTKTFERATYKLTFALKSTIAGNGVVGVGVRTSDDAKGFRISSLYNGKRNQAAINFTAEEIVTGWKTFSMELDLTQASSTTNLTDQDSFDTTTPEEVQGITILFFNNLNGASAAYDTYIKDIVFQKVQ